MCLSSNERQFLCSSMEEDAFIHCQLWFFKCVYFITDGIKSLLFSLEFVLLQSVCWLWFRWTISPLKWQTVAAICSLRLSPSIPHQLVKFEVDRSSGKSCFLNLKKKKIDEVVKNLNFYGAIPLLSVLLWLTVNRFYSLIQLQFVFLL